MTHRPRRLAAPPAALLAVLTIAIELGRADSQGPDSPTVVSPNAICADDPMGIMRSGNVTARCLDLIQSYPPFGCDAEDTAFIPRWGHACMG